MNIKQLPESERPREKMLKEGREKLSTTEILVILLGSGTAKRTAFQIASDLLSMDSQGIRFLADCRPEEMMAISGMGDAKICTILAAVELGKRIATAPKIDKPVISSSNDIVNNFMERMRYYKKEYFISVMLNAKGEIIQEVQISIGDLNSSSTHPREVFIEAVRRSAGSVIFIHNHPSGDPTPSVADIDTTKRLIQVGELLGIPVLDHIIIGDGVYISMKAEGII